MLANTHLEWLKEYPACPAEEFERRRQLVLAEAGLTDAICQSQTSPKLQVSISQISNESGPSVKCELVPETLDTNVPVEVEEDLAENANETEVGDLDTIKDLGKWLCLVAAPYLAPLFVPINVVLFYP